MRTSHVRNLVAVLFVGSVLAPGPSLAGDKGVTLTTAALDFKTTFVCSVVNVGTAPVDVTIELLYPGSGQPLYLSTTVSSTLQPGWGTSNEYTLSVGFSSAYCKVTHSKDGTVRAAACAKAAQNEGCQGVSEAR
jgi:hypothetical protein